MVRLISQYDRLLATTIHCTVEYRAGHIRVPCKTIVPFGIQIRFEGIEAHARSLEFFIALSTQHQYQYSVRTQGTRQCHLEEQTQVHHFTP
jgi:hypothetical protein